jgi:hypothetical protein
MHRLRISSKLITATAGACRLRRLPGEGESAGVPGRRRGAGGAAGLVAVLTAVGVLGLAPSVALAGSSPVRAWTQQHPGDHPVGRYGGSMAYDAATGSVVLFSGEGTPADTWVWDGTTWTQRHPATHPSARFEASVAYDAATGSVVLFSGLGGRPGNLRDTWTWG